MKQILLLFISVFALTTNAAVITKDINYSLTAGVYQVDVNNNGTKDLFFRLKYDNGSQTIYCRFGVIDLNGSVDNSKGTEGDWVGNNANWTDSMNIFTAPGGFIDGSSWCLGGDTGYFAFAFAEGSNYYKGWMQVNTVSANNLRIIRCSYNNVPDADINFGELGTTGINSTAEEKASINLAGRELSVNAQPVVLEGAQLVVCDLTGRLCATKEITAADSRLSLNGVLPGIYIASFYTAGGKVVSKKIAVE